MFHKLFKPVLFAGHALGSLQGWMWGAGMIPNILSFLYEFNEQYGVLTIVGDFIINLLIGFALILLIVILCKMFKKEHWVFKKRYFEKAKEFNVKNGQLLLTVKLINRIEHTDDVSHFVSVTVKNTAKRTIKNVKLTINNTKIFHDITPVMVNLNSNEETSSIVSDAVHMDRKTGLMKTYLTDISNSKLIHFSCKFSAENIPVKNVIFAIQGTEDIYEKIEMSLSKLSRN